jgi:hypothetical protein
MSCSLDCLDTIWSHRQTTRGIVIMHAVGLRKEGALNSRVIISFADVKVADQTWWGLTL